MFGTACQAGCVLGNGGQLCSSDADCAKNGIWPRCVSDPASGIHYCTR
jgi:hypothetical protein